MVVVLRLPLTTVDTVSAERHRAGRSAAAAAIRDGRGEGNGVPAASVRSSGFDDVTLTPTPLSACTDSASSR